MTHSLLARQLSKHLPGMDSALHARLAGFLAAVGAAYAAADEDRAMAAHSLETMSNELQQRYKALQEELELKNRFENSLRAINEQLEGTISQLETAQTQLLQADKLASIGQLAAGVAHEINNPIGFVYSNLSTLEGYIADLLELLGDYEAQEMRMDEATRQHLAQHKERCELDYLRDDLPQLMQESKDGITRVKKIVRDLRDFSHADTGEKDIYDLHEGLNSTLNLVNNELKNRAKVVCEFSELPLVECSLAQLNQVFLNLLINAAHALDGKNGEIRIVTGHHNGEVWVSISDNGCGIKPENLNKIFDAFFTTKPIGQGTGLGLSLSYSIVQSHHGRMEVQSAEGVGTTFTIRLPVMQPAG